MQDQGVLFGQIAVVFGIVIAGVWVATQWTAAALGYQLRLGPPWFDFFSIPIYHPWRLFECPASLKNDLDRYAALHAQTYGEAVDASALIPHMLEAFMAGDRGFRRGRAEGRRSSPRVSAPQER
ncbi:hypothetical protein WK02_00365 [Burkholderia cepacia]|nr:hypothetical protein WJ46_20140 [Burkholderia cepacia]KVQ34345.1 hypothetical protein WK02_00365 [Burkholderia cepacia]